MRVLLISTADLQGGAARAGYRLMLGLRAAGEDCSMLVSRKFSSDPGVHTVNLDASDQARKVNRELELIRSECIENRRTALSNTWFSLPAPGYDISADPRVVEADILHLHWVSEFLSPASVTRLQQLGKPVLWTLHDQRPFTGGCHYSAGCAGFERDCRNCPQLASDETRIPEVGLAESLECVKPGLVVLSPSRWMAECARRSALFRSTRVEVIPNGVDTNIFIPGRATARQELRWAPEAIYFLAGADAGQERRKGLHLLTQAISVCLANENFKAKVDEGAIRFVMFGPEISEAGFPVQQLGRMDSEAALAKLYAAADAFLLPSTEDNLPNTMLESLCSGTPVIGFRVGGIPEAIREQVNGLLASPSDAHHYARLLMDFAQDGQLRIRLSAGCAEARECFSLHRQAQRHQDLYRELSPNAKAITCPGGPVQECALLPFGSAYCGAYPELLKSARRRRSKRRWRTLLRTLRLAS